VATRKRRPVHPPMAPWYVTYLASCDWREKRERIFLQQGDSRGPFCQDCKRVRKGLILHHVTYARVLQERDEDFRILCPWCHKRAHRTHDIPYLWAIYQERDEEVFEQAEGEKDFQYPKLREKKVKAKPQ